MKKFLWKGYDLSTIVDSLKQVYLAKNIDNLQVQLAIKSVYLYFISYYITIVYLILDSNKLTYLFWSPTITINFLDVYD